MKRLLAIIIAAVILAASIGFTACGKSEEPGQEETAAVKQEKKEVDMEFRHKAEEFLQKYLADFEKAYTDQATTYWKAANSGKKEDFDAYAAADLALKQLHSDPQRYAEIEKFLAQKDKLEPLTARSLKVAELAFKESQLPKDMLEKLVNMAADIEQTFNTFRGKVDNKAYTDNQLLEMLKKANDSSKRQKTWEVLKQVGEAVAPKLIRLAKIRNEAARKLGFKNYWEMQVRIQEHDPDQLVSIFTELEGFTDQPFKQMKARMDSELAARFKIKPEEMMPWHYDNPFFQAAPPSDKVDLDEFYQNKPKEEIIELTKKFFNDIALPIDDIVQRSDIYEREGKQQHAFCTSLDQKGDTRVLMNIQPTAEWMDTSLHEMGHGVYCQFTDFSLPYNLRDAAHAFTTEAVAQLFGALAKNPLWMVTYAGADQKRVKEVEAAILEQRRREQLIFARWSLVMLYFEKALYENPDQDLNTLWWDLKERFQVLKRPKGRNAPDWAAKIHFSTFPVYYHNYMLGELLASQLRAVLVKIAQHQGPASTMDYRVHKEFGNYFKEKIFKTGMTDPWPEFVKKATGEPLTARYFAEEVK
jgi:peptidyl-dipeptidase A